MGRYLIAGLQVDMEPMGRMVQQAKPYAVEENGPAELQVVTNPQRLMELEPSLPNEEVAFYMGSGANFARKLLLFDGFQLHASAVLLEGKAYLFSAPSGTGKSTHTEKWCRLFGAEYLNDDKPALRRMENGWVAYGTPWSGKHDLSSPQSAPLGGIAFLQRGQENTIRPLAPAEAVPLLISQSMRHLNEMQMSLQLALLDRLLQEVPVWLLTCRNDDEAAQVSRRAMAYE